MSLQTLRELYTFNRWANEIIFGEISKLSDGQVDRPFEMGSSTIRATFWHCFFAERIWFERIGGTGHAGIPSPTERDSVEAVHAASLKLHALRSAWMETLTDRDLARMVDFKDRSGAPWTKRLFDILLHVCNHGIYHRAQIVNMIRRVGAEVPRPGPDYIVMKWHQPEETKTPLEVAPIRRWYAYSDAVQREMHAVAGGLSDEQLDRPFEMGLGSLRKTLAHLHYAEWWWGENWARGPVGGFPKGDETFSVRELSARMDELASKRNALLETMSDSDLARSVKIAPRPDMTRVLPIGVSMIQLCAHGTHHRAQANNMLRHVGATPLKLDFIAWACD